jgi:hypothetical protein
MMSDTFWPNPIPVASRILVFVNSAVDRDLLERSAGMMIIEPKKIGPKIVAKMNHFVLTRSRYSRLMIAQSLAMSGHPHLDACGTDFLEEDLVQ